MCKTMAPFLTFKLTALIALVIGLCVVNVVARGFTNCFTRCRCTKQETVVLCVGVNLDTVPMFPAHEATKITILGIQRNQISSVDGALVMLQLPALEVIDVRDQVGLDCVLLSSPFPPHVKLFGEYKKVLYDKLSYIFSF